MERYKIGVDLGGTNIAAGLLDENDKLVSTMSCRTNLPRPEAEVEQSIAELCRTLAETNEVDIAQQVDWVGVGTPGSVNAHTGIVEFNANFGYWNWQLRDHLSALLGCPVYIENDANAAAYGEYIAGGARGAKYAVVITLGTGIGSGIIIDGKIFTGFNSAGAEIGHTVIIKDGRRCMCGRQGCWEKYASARALAEDTRAALEARPDNMMHTLIGGDLTKVNARTAFDGMRAGDQLAIDLVDQYISYVACGITNVINIFQPEIICVGGGISREGETLLAPLRALVDKEDFARKGMKRTTIVTAQLHNDAGIVGAAALGKQHL